MYETRSIYLNFMANFCVSKLFPCCVRLRSRVRGICSSSKCRARRVAGSEEPKKVEKKENRVRRSAGQRGSPRVASKLGQLQQLRVGRGHHANPSPLRSGRQPNCKRTVLLSPDHTVHTVLYRYSDLNSDPITLDVTWRYKHFSS
jgi:hypothetical protein